MNYIQGEKFKNIKGDNIYYSNTHDVINLLKSNIKERFVLITHNSDNKINDRLVEFMPNNLIRWFGQNVCVRHDKIESIPIGLENSEWFIETRKIEKIFLKIKEERKIKNLLYINHNINTNTNQRLKPYNIFKDSKYTTLVYGKNGYDFDSYLDDVYNHKFVLSPEGNGTDTHRTWECLYLGTIPIEKRNINNSFYQDLPICFVDDWEEISEDFLEKEYERIKNTKYNLEKLDFSYWENKIKNVR